MADLKSEKLDKIADKALFASRGTIAAKAKSPFAAIKAKVEGVYILEKWQLGDQTARPPQVDGRFALSSGAVITILHNRSDDSNQVTVAAYGAYELDSQRFSYRFDDFSMYVRFPSGISKSNKPPWEGMRGFSVITADNGVRFRSDDGQQEFWFEPDGTTSYFENGEVLRIWKRASEQP